MLRMSTWRVPKPHKAMAMVFVIVLVTHCQRNHSYHIHLGQPFYALDQLSYARFLGTDVLRNQRGEVYRMKGIYTKPDSAMISDPLLRVYEHGVGLKYALLSTELEAEDGDLVEVGGRIIHREIRMEKIQTVQKKEMLEPEDIQIVNQSSRLKDVTQREYLKLKDMVQEQIAPERSRLILPHQPRWYIVWSESDQSYIISARITDLMYQAEIDFVWSEALDAFKAVYAVEWFKGE